jgi:hypothetical protein
LYLELLEFQYLLDALLGLTVQEHLEILQHPSILKDLKHPVVLWHLVHLEHQEHPEVLELLAGLWLLGLRYFLAVPYYLVDLSVLSYLQNQYLL